MERLTKEALLGASDLVEREVDLPSIGGSVKVRSLSAAYSNQASSEALVYETFKGEQRARIDSAKLEVLQALHGLVEPKLNSLGEAEVFAKRCGPAFKKVIETIDEISGIDKDAIEDAQATFRGGGSGEGGKDLAPGNGARSDRSDKPVRAGA